MIIAGWLLALLGLAQVIYAGTMEVTQTLAGNRLLGEAPSVIANADLLAQRGMIHQSGLACFLAGAVFLAAAYLKPAPEGVRPRAWTSLAALAAAALAIAAAIGFGLLFYDMRIKGQARLLADEARLKQARAEAAARLLAPAAIGLASSDAPPSDAVVPGSSSPED